LELQFLLVVQYPLSLHHISYQHPLLLDVQLEKHKIN